MGFAARANAALGEAVHRRGGPLVAELVEGLTVELAATDELLAPTARGWASVFDLDLTPMPAWLGQATGIRVPDGLSLDEQRAYVRGRFSRRGTPAAIRAAIRPFLSGSQLLTLIERNGSPWRVTIRVYASQLPPVNGPAKVLAAALTEKPVGILLDVQVITGATYAHMTAEHGTYDDFAADFPTYTEAIVHIPEEV